MTSPDDDADATPQRVERTGIALVHEGERIYATEPGKALFAAEGGQVVNYYFPVEIEIVGPGSPEALAERIYEALQRELGALG
jgi:hypothetical protein